MTARQPETTIPDDWADLVAGISNEPEFDPAVSGALDHLEEAAQSIAAARAIIERMAGLS